MTRRTSYLIIALLCFTIAILLIRLNWVSSELTETQISRNLWHQHALRTADWRMDHYESNYNYLTKGGSDES